MTYYEALKETEKRLSESGLENSAGEAFILFEYITGMDRMHFILEKQGCISEKALCALRNATEKRCTHIPLQHITGEQDFCGYAFKVTPDVLVPRQDTEVVVEETFKRLSPGMHILDMCTGSGCILISLLKMAEEKFGTGRVTGVGVDRSEKALLVAQENNETLGAAGKFLLSALFHNTGNEYFDLIVSNPPYIPTDVIATLSDDVRLFDPLMALDGKEDGLFFYRRIIAEAPKHLQDGGHLVFEIGADQAIDVRRLMEERGFEDISVKKDLAHLDRVVCGRYNKR